ncbi:MAG: hypothetical protein R3C05_06235 [Pirellulaceae bacterium]
MDTRGNNLTRRKWPIVDLHCESRSRRLPMARRLCWGTIVLLVGCWVSGSMGQWPAEPNAESEDEPIREIFVPFEDLNVLLESNTNHVFLTREQYDALIERAKQSPEKSAPVNASMLSARYDATLQSEAVFMDVTLEIEVLRSGLHAIPLSLSEVGVLEASLDGQPAAIGSSDEGKLAVFVEGIGKHQLDLRLACGVAVGSTQQTFSFQVPTPPATSFQLLCPGNVQLSGGGQVVARRYDASADQTRLDVLLNSGINNFGVIVGDAQLQAKNAIVAKSVLVNEVTETYERLYATVSMQVLHGETARYRFVVPKGFDIIDVQSTLMSKFEVQEEEGRSILVVSLRSPTNETQVLNVTAERTSLVDAKADASTSADRQWNAPNWISLDTVASSAVVGVFLDRRLDVQGLQAEELIPIDTAIVASAIPEGLFDAQPGAPVVRPVAAYYAPQGEFEMSGMFRKSPAAVNVATHLLFTIGQQQHMVRGQFSLTPTQEKLFETRIAVPPQWHVSEVTDGQQRPLDFELIAADDDNADQTLRLRWPSGIVAGQRGDVLFRATHTPVDWLSDWRSTTTSVPSFRVLDARSTLGTIVVSTIDDLSAQPQTLVELQPLGEKRKAELGLQGVEGPLAYQFKDAAWSAILDVTRGVPQLTAESFSFFKIQPEGIDTHSEIVYDVSQAGARELSFRLPLDAPETLSVVGGAETQVKEYSSIVDDDGRLWARVWLVLRLASIS